ncbi:hypothetical protein BZA70DRAFT_278971 [Myxozyma melibiosi]|uniref:tRNA-splicing endonuclease subunit Sen2 n=1 Tax=Myxozyma melibiosi TaxID=54550 RepID=A0ABR1F7K4_9ASCO
MPPKNRRNLNALYPDPLPVKVLSLPPVIPHNPVSLAQYIYAVVAQPVLAGFKRPRRFTGSLEKTSDAVSSYVSSIYIESEEDMQGLWRAGFFGKGSQSRSDPTWELRVVKRLNVPGREGMLAPEELTARRREARKRMKEERALAEQATASPEKITTVDASIVEKTETARPKKERAEDENLLDGQGNVRRLERLEITPQEAFFLTYALDVLDIYDDHTGDRISAPHLLGLLMPDWRPDNDFIMKYVVYHHYRSHGWCIRNGVKFGVDYLLYRRGPPFSHAEFGIIILPHYKDEARSEAAQRREWAWVSGVNRIVGGVKKTLILCYVEVPESIDTWHTVEELLTRYKVREVSFTRWLPSRNRD